jgi:hypothetical protein
VIGMTAPSDGRGFPALGLDPAPGSAGAVHAVIEALAQVADQLIPAGALLTATLKAQDWSGSAADGFRQAGGDLPRSLASGAQSLSRAGTALMTWATQLAANQREADDLEKQAETVKQELAAAQTIASTASQEYDADPSQANLDRSTLLSNYSQTIDAQLWALQLKAQELLQKHTAQAKKAATAIRAAGNDQPFEPTQHEGFIASALDTLTSIAGDASVIFRTLASVAAVFPPAEEVAGVLETASFVTGGVATLSGLAQHAVGSPNAPNALALLVSSLPTRGIGAAISDARKLNTAREETTSLWEAFGAKTRTELADRVKDSAGMTFEEQVAAGRELAQGNARAAVAFGAVNVGAAVNGTYGDPGPTLLSNGVAFLVNPSVGQLTKSVLNTVPLADR